MIILLFAVWLIFHGRFTWDVLVLGVGVCAALGIFLRKTGIYKSTGEIAVLRRLPRVLIFLALLFVEVVKANFHMIYLVLVSNELEPHLIYFKSPVRTEAGKVVLANTITLTPGTLTIDIKDDEFCVHAIDRPSKEGLRNPWSVKRIREMEDMK